MKYLALLPRSLFAFAFYMACGLGVYYIGYGEPDWHSALPYIFAFLGIYIGAVWLVIAFVKAVFWWLILFIAVFLLCAVYIAAGGRLPR